MAEAEQVSLLSITAFSNSSQFKAEGGKAFAAKDFPRAIELYTKVYISPLDSP